MAVIAVIAAGDMRWILAGCNDTIVARTASADYLGVIHCVRWNPDIGIVTIFANFCCQNMRRVLAGRFNTVVAACAITGDTNVVEVRGQPASC